MPVKKVTKRSAPLEVVDKKAEGVSVPNLVEMKDNFMKELGLAKSDTGVPVIPSSSVCEEAIKAFPDAAIFWKRYIEITSDNDSKIEIGSRAVKLVPSQEVWFLWIEAVKERVVVEEMAAAYQRAIDEGIACDINAKWIWEEYTYILKCLYNYQLLKTHNLIHVRSASEIPKDIALLPVGELPKGLQKIRERLLDNNTFAAAERVNPDVNKIRSLLQQALCTPLVGLDQVKQSYKLFERTLAQKTSEIEKEKLARQQDIKRMQQEKDPALVAAAMMERLSRGENVTEEAAAPVEVDPRSSGEQLADRLMFEFDNRYVASRGVLKGLVKLYNTVDSWHVSLPLPQLSPSALAAHQKQVEAWRNILKFESSNPLQLPSRYLVEQRMRAVYNRALMHNVYCSEFWYEYFLWLFNNGHEKEALSFLRRGIASKGYLPGDQLLHQVLALALEDCGEKKDADLEFAILLKFSEGKGKPCPSGAAQYVKFCCRNYGLEGGRELLAHLLENSIHATPEFLCDIADFEWRGNKEKEAAKTLYEVAMESAANDPDCLKKVAGLYSDFLLDTEGHSASVAVMKRGGINRTSRTGHSRLEELEEGGGRAIKEMQVLELVHALSYRHLRPRRTLPHHAEEIDLEPDNLLQQLEVAVGDRNFRRPILKKLTPYKPEGGGEEPALHGMSTVEIPEGDMDPNDPDLIAFMRKSEAEGALSDPSGRIPRVLTDFLSLLPISSVRPKVLSEIREDGYVPPKKGAQEHLHGPLSFKGVPDSETIIQNLYTVKLPPKINLQSYRDVCMEFSESSASKFTSVGLSGLTEEEHRENLRKVDQLNWKKTLECRQRNKMLAEAMGKYLQEKHAERREFVNTWQPAGFGIKDAEWQKINTVMMQPRDALHQLEKCNEEAARKRKRDQKETPEPEEEVDEFDEMEKKNVDEVDRDNDEILEFFGALEDNIFRERLQYKRKKLLHEMKVGKTDKNR